MATAAKKFRHDIFDGEVAIKPHSFVISGAGEFVDVPDITIPNPVPGVNHPQANYHRYIATSSNTPFLPAIGGKTLVNDSFTFDAGDSRTSSPGINPHSYRRIPFVHKCGGSNTISQPGTYTDQAVIEEVLRINFPGKAGDVYEKQGWQSPFSGMTIQMVVFPFGRSAPFAGETNSFEAANNYVHALGNLTSTIYYKQHYTWHPISPEFTYGSYHIHSGSGDPLNGPYTTILRNDKSWRHAGVVLPSGPQIAFHNGVGSMADTISGFDDIWAGGQPFATSFNGSEGNGFNDFNNYQGLYAFDPVNSFNTDAQAIGFGGIDPLLTQAYPEGHPHAGKAKYYTRSTINPVTQIADGNGPIEYQGENYYPVNQWVGTNTKADPTTPNSLVRPYYRDGHQGEVKPFDSLFHFYSKTRTRGLIVKGLIEIY